MVEPPAAATTLAAVQVPVTVAGVARTRFAGRVSTKSAFNVRTEAFVLPSVSVSEEFEPSAIEVGENAFAIVGSASTWRFAAAATALTPASVWSAPDAIVFAYVRTVEDVTFTWIVQPPLPGRTAPD